MGTDAEQGATETGVDSFRRDRAAESSRLRARVLVVVEGRHTDLAARCAWRNESDDARECDSTTHVSIATS